LSSGENPRYVIWVYNSGNVKLTDVKIVDEALGDLDDFDIGDLEPEQEVTVDAVGKWAAGAVKNVARVVGKYGDKEVTSSDSVTYVGTEPALL
jgi:uncharacterized membrane protein